MHLKIKLKYYFSIHQLITFGIDCIYHQYWQILAQISRNVFFFLAFSKMEQSNIRLLGAIRRAQR